MLLNSLAIVSLMAFSTASFSQMALVEYIKVNSCLKDAYIGCGQSITKAHCLHLPP